MMHAPIPTRPIEAPTAGPPVLPSVALFIDGDNIAPTRCAAVVAIAAREGRVQTARAYCNAQTLAGGAACPGGTPIGDPQTGNGKGRPRRVAL